MKWLTIISLLFSFNVRADDSAATATTILLLFGAARTSQYALHSGQWPAELADWKDPRTKLTADIVEKCDYLLEGRLLGTNRHNMLVLITKGLKSDVKFNPQDVVFEFENGVVRRGDVDFEQEYTIPKLSKYVIVIPLPRKDDFFEQNKLSVTVPFANDTAKCEAKLEFSRPAGVSPELSTYTRLTSFEMELGYGNAQASGDMKNFGPKTNSLFQVGFNFMGPQHGTYFSYTGVNKAGIDTQIASDVGHAGTDSEALLSFVTLGYVNRRILSKRSLLYSKLGIESARLQIQEKGDASDRTAFDAIGFNGQIAYNYTFAQVDSGAWMGDYGVSIGIDAHYLSEADTDGDLGFAGTMLGLLVNLRIGY